MDKIIEAVKDYERRANHDMQKLFELFDKYVVNYWVEDSTSTTYIEVMRTDTSESEYFFGVGLKSCLISLAEELDTKGVQP